MSSKKYKVSFNQKTLLVNDGEFKVAFEYPITKILQLESVIVVLIEPPINKTFNENIFCISYGGKILWQVIPFDHFEQDNPYTGIMQKEGRLFAYNWDGFEYQIDLKTGEILNREYVK